METPLGLWIRSRLETSGPVPFERFMAWCLYHPLHGYYTSGRTRVGHDQGDYTTAPHLSVVFARCLARLIAAADKALSSPRPFTLLEGGPGEGRLARDLLDSLQERAPELYRRLLYIPEERSRALRERQAVALSAHHARIALNATDRRFVGLYLSNELLDSFPVHRLVRSGGDLLEIHVGVTEGRLVEILRPPSTPGLLDYLAAEEIEIVEGCEVEVNLRALGWMGSVVRRLRRGYVVTVDYGDEGCRLYGPRRPCGTCVAYRDHRIAQDLLDAPGLQDITAHVNFSAIRRAGTGHGLVSAPLLNQRDFLFALGLAEEVKQFEACGLPDAELIGVRQAIAPLIFPGPGMGESFKVLVQAKGASLNDLGLETPGIGLGTAAST